MDQPLLPLLETWINDDQWCSMMINDAQWWSMMINDDQWWSMMINDDQWWSMMINDDQWWSMMINDDQWWSMMINDDQWWSMMINDDQWWSMFNRKSSDRGLQRLRSIALPRASSWARNLSRKLQWMMWSTGNHGFLLTMFEVFHGGPLMFPTSNSGKSGQHNDDKSVAYDLWCFPVHSLDGKGAIWHLAEKCPWWANLDTQKQKSL